MKTKKRAVTCNKYSDIRKTGKVVSKQNTPIQKLKHNNCARFKGHNTKMQK